MVTLTSLIWFSLAQGHGVQQKHTFLSRCSQKREKNYYYVKCEHEHTINFTPAFILNVAKMNRINIFSFENILMKKKLLINIEQELYNIQLKTCNIFDEIRHVLLVGVVIE